MLENLGTWIVKCLTENKTTHIRWRNTNLYLSRCKVQIQSGQNSGPVVFCRVMQSDGQRAAPLRSVTCWHLCILCHLLYIHISYIISHHTTLGISLLCTILMHITQFNTIYILSTITQITRSIRMSLYMLICVVHSQVVGLICLFAFVFL